MTPQQIFTTAFLGVIGQGCFSVDIHGTCQYRGPNGAKCPVGFLIDDETATAWEGAPIWMVARNRLPTGIAANFGLCRSIQAAHDTASRLGEGIPGYRRRMIKVAARYNLEVPDV